MQKKLLKFLTLSLSMQLLFSPNLVAQEKSSLFDNIKEWFTGDEARAKKGQEEKWRAADELWQKHLPKNKSFFSELQKIYLKTFASTLGFVTVYAAFLYGYYYFNKHKTKLFPKKPTGNSTTTPITFEPYIQEHIDIITNYFNQGTKKIADNVPLTDADIPVGMVLHGPPGTGKTMFARALLQKGIPLFEIAGIESMWIGQSEANLRSAYEEAKNYLNAYHVPFVVVFIDEADSFLSKRSSGDMAIYDKHNNKLVDEFLRLTDGLDETSKRIVTIVSTNHYDSLDDAAVRAGRLTKKVEFKQINNKMARSIFDDSCAQLDKKASPELTEFLEKHFDAIQLSSAAEWATVPRVAYEYAILEGASEISMKHFLKAILSINPGNHQATILLKILETGNLNINAIDLQKKSSTTEKYTEKGIIHEFDGTLAELQAIIDRPELIVVDFSAPWCGPCTALHPILEKIAQETNILIVKINGDTHPELIQHYKISGFPTLILFNQGKEVKRTIGFKKQNELYNWIQK